MEVNRIKMLEANYWDGTSSLEEEQRFFNLSEEEQSLLFEDSRQAIAMKSSIASLKLGSDFENEFWAKTKEKSQNQSKVVTIFSSNFFLKYAAVGVVLVALGFSIGQFLSKENRSTIASTELKKGDTFLTPEEALAETKRALLFASNKLNKGKKHLNELSRLDKGMHAAEANTK